MNSIGLCASILMAVFISLSDPAQSPFIANISASWWCRSGESGDVLKLPIQPHDFIVRIHRGGFAGIWLLTTPSKSGNQCDHPKGTISLHKKTLKSVGRLEQRISA
jgi:hypothetical protein